MLFSGVLVSDFYAAYSHYAGLKQRCWVHLLRDIDELEALYPQDTGLGRWANSMTGQRRPLTTPAHQT